MEGRLCASGAAMITGGFQLPSVIEYWVELGRVSGTFYAAMPFSPPPADEPFSQDDDGFFEQVYNELRLLAHSKMSKEFHYSTLQGTALVHEAWMRLGADKQPKWQNKGHFFGAAAEAMRRILVDRARKRNTAKHGGELERAADVDLNELEEELNMNEQFLKLNEALEKLEQSDERKALVVKLRYFFGMSFQEVADTMNISVPTAKLWWAFSRSWLHRKLSST